MIADRLCEALRRHLACPGRPVVPAGGELLWRWFVDLSAARTWGMAGPDPISFDAIEAYRRLAQWPIEERHVRVLSALDAVFLEHFRRDAGKGDPEIGAAPRVSSRPISAGLFDAIFGG